MNWVLAIIILLLITANVIQVAMMFIVVKVVPNILDRERERVAGH